MPETQNNTNQKDHNVDNQNKVRSALFLAVEGNILLRILTTLLPPETPVPEEITRNIYAVGDRVTKTVARSLLTFSEIDNLYNLFEKKLGPAVYSSLAGKEDIPCVLDHWRGEMPPKKAYFSGLL